MTEDPQSPPYSIRFLDGDRAVIIFPEFLDDPRTEEHATELQSLVEKARSIAVDATRSSSISSDWLRMLYRLTSTAEQSGKTVGIVGLSEVLLESADVLGIKDHLEIFEAVQEVWES